MLCFYVFRRNQLTTQDQIDRILNAFRKSHGGEVVMLGGSAVNGDPPREPDMYVVVTLRVCKEKNIVFDSNGTIWPI